MCSTIYHKIAQKQRTNYLKIYICDKNPDILTFFHVKSSPKFYNSIIGSTQNAVRRTGRTGRRIQGMKENVGVVNPAGDVKRRNVL